MWRSASASSEKGHQPAATRPETRTQASPAGFSDKRPEGLIQRQQQEMMKSRQTTASTPVIQRYENTPNGKLSIGKQLLLNDSQHLYAGDAQFKQANGINGDIEFIKGEKEHVTGGELKRVIPKVKPKSGLHKSMEGYKEQDEKTHITREAKKRHFPSVDDLYEQLKKEILPQWKLVKDTPEEARKLFGTDKAGELKTFMEKMAEFAHELLLHIGDFRESDISVALEKYLSMQQQFRDAPLLPSDCRALASYTAGFDAGSSGEETDEIEAGNVYEYMPSNSGTAEWSFHYATIIMTDSSDHITLENAAAKNSEQFSKLQYDHTWFFEMYGSSKNQTFGYKYARDMGN